MRSEFSVLVVFIFAAIAGCDDSLTEDHKELNEDNQTEEVLRIQWDEMSSLFDSLGVEGSILLFDAERNELLSNDYVWAEKQRLPASTFKIPNSIIALETGVVSDEFTVMKWDGTKKWRQEWEQDLAFKDAFQYSCVPCYQEIARKIGVKRMNEWLDKLEFGKMIVDSSTIDNFWLSGESKISQFEQMDFLVRFNLGELPISDRTREIVREIMILEKTEKYCLMAKTGWASGDSYENGWFVGFLEQNGNTYYFATNISPKKNCPREAFLEARSVITREALRLRGINI